MKYLNRTIWVLSLVSLFTDVASEMLYPVMPIYLRSIGFTAVIIGLLEGFAEATAGLSKGYFGQRSDRSGKRVPFIRLGYGLSAVAKPMLAAFVYPLWIFLARTIERLGKGIRTSARDALLSDQATHATKGRIFGFHRSMDTIGAVIGPLIALAWLYYNPGHYRWLFLISFIPGVLAILLTFLLKREKTKPLPPKNSLSFFAFLRYWNESPVSYRKLVPGLWVFALANSSDVFLLLRTKQAGLKDTATIGIYVFYNVIYALAAFPLGRLADHIGLKKVFVCGLLLFTLVYCGMALPGGWPWYLLLFFLYGLYAAATEGISKAWISNIVPATQTATAIGAYTAIQSICTLLASTLTGWIWTSYGSPAAFLISAAMSLAVSILILITGHTVNG